MPQPVPIIRKFSAINQEVPAHIHTPEDTSTSLNSTWFRSMEQWRHHPCSALEGPWGCGHVCNVDSGQNSNRSQPHYSVLAMLLSEVYQISTRKGRERPLAHCVFKSLGSAGIKASQARSSAPWSPSAVLLTSHTAGLVSH